MLRHYRGTEGEGESLLRLTIPWPPSLPFTEGIYTIEFHETVCSSRE